MMKSIRSKTKQDWSQQVLKDIERWQKCDEQKKRKQQNYFDRIYDKTKKVEFKSMEELNLEKYFNMPKISENFRFGSYNALAIYPVLCGRADFWDDKKWVRISRDNIGRLAGICTEAVDKGVKELRHLNFRTNEIQIPFLQRREWRDGKRRGYEYLPGFFRYGTETLNPNRWHKKYFTFHTCIVDNGVWAKLSRKAKALYLAMRSSSFFDRQAYEHIEGVRILTLEEIYDGEAIPEDGKKKYRDRKWDVCDTTLKELFGLADIPYRDTRQLVDELENTGLVERVHQTKSLFKVFLRPRPLLKN